MRIIMLLFMLLLLAVYSLPYLIRDQVVVWLYQQGAESVTFKKFSINWWRGQVEIDQLHATREGKPALDIGYLRVGIDYSDLLEKRVRISQLWAADINSGLQQQDDQLWLGPVNLSQWQSEETETPDTAPTSWQFGIANIAFANLRWQLQLPDFAHTLWLQQGALNALSQWDQEAITHILLTGKLNDSAFSIDSDVTPLPDKKTTQLKIKLSEFPLQPLLKPWVPALSGVLTTDLTVSLALQNEQLQIEHDGSIDLAEFGWKQPELSIQNRTLAWQGQGAVTLAQWAPEQVSVQGKINSQGFTLTQADLNTALGALAWQGEASLSWADQQLKSIKGPQALTLNQLTLSQGDLKLALQRLTQQGALTVAFKNNSAASISTSLAAKGQKLSVQQPDLAVELADIDLKGPLAVNLAAEQLSAKPVAQVSQLKVQQGDALQIIASSLGLNATLENMAFAEPAARGVSLTGQDIRVDTLKQPLHVASVAKLEANNGYYSAHALGVERLRVLNTTLNQPNGGQPMVQWQALELDSLALTEQNSRLQIEQIRLKGSNTALTLTEQQTIAELEQLEQALMGDASSSSTAEVAEQDIQSSPFSVAIAQLALEQGNRLRFKDLSVQPGFQSDLDIQQLTVGNIDTRDAKLSPFALKATLNKRAQLEGAGNVVLVGDKRDGDWRITLKNAELPVVSPYAGKYVGYYLQSGKLQLTSEGTLKANVLSGENRIVLNRLEVKPAQSEATAAFNQKLSMPLGTAISVLQDSSNNIKLEIPVEGSLDDPQFGYQSIINRLATKGLKQAALSFLTKSLQPYGALITLASKAIAANNSGAFITLAPVEFAPAGKQPQASANDYLTKIVAMLKERQGMQLNICGNAVSKDRQVLLPVLQKENAKRDKPLPPEQLEISLMEQLQTLAVQRGEVVTQQLIAKGVKKDRLFSCYPVPDLSDETLTPGVVLAL